MRTSSRMQNSATLVGPDPMWPVARHFAFSLLIFPHTLQRLKTENAAALDEVSDLQEEKRMGGDELTGLQAQLALFKSKAAKGTDLNSKLLGLLSQVVGAESEAPAQGILHQVQGFSSASVSALAS